MNDELRREDTGAVCGEISEKADGSRWECRRLVGHPLPHACSRPLCPEEAEAAWTDYGQGTPDQRRVSIYLESIGYVSNAADAYRHLLAVIEEVRTEEREACAHELGEVAVRLMASNSEEARVVAREAQRLRGLLKEDADG